MQNLILHTRVGNGALGARQQLVCTSIFDIVHVSHSLVNYSGEGSLLHATGRFSMRAEIAEIAAILLAKHAHALPNYVIVCRSVLNAYPSKFIPYIVSQ